MGKLKNHYLNDEELTLSPLQLGDLMDGSVCVEAWCSRCGHYQMIEPSHLVKRLGARVSVPEIGVYMECEICNSKDIAARPIFMEPEPLMMMAAG